MTKWIPPTPVTVVRVVGSMAHVRGDGKTAMIPVSWLVNEEPLPPAHRTPDHATSVQAAGLPNKDTHRHQMLVAYSLWPDGLTDEEAAAVASLEHACYWKRSSELRATGMIEDTGLTRKGSAGTERIVCQITDEGRRRLRFLREQP